MNFNWIIMATPQHTHTQGEQWRRCGTDRCWIRNKLNKWWHAQLPERRWNGKCVQKQTPDCALCMKNAQSTMTSLFIYNTTKCPTANDDKDDYHFYASLSTSLNTLCFRKHVYFTSHNVGVKKKKMQKMI